jgi:hypothetical protein
LILTGTPLLDLSAQCALRTRRTTFVISFFATFCSNAFLNTKAAKNAKAKISVSRSWKGGAASPKTRVGGFRTRDMRQFVKELTFSNQSLDGASIFN